MHQALISLLLSSFVILARQTSLVSLASVPEITILHQELGNKNDPLISSFNYTSSENVLVNGAAAEVLEPIRENVPSKQGSCSCGVRNPNGAPRIVGGSPTKSGEIPWRAAVFVYDKSTEHGGACGGTIISPNWILTAAHCTKDIKQGVHAIDIYVGAQSNPLSVRGGTLMTADKYIQHPAFNSKNFDNDISLVHLPQPLQYEANVSPACLPFGSLSNSEFDGAKVLASGWGTTKPVPVNRQNRDPTSDTLRMVELPLLTTAQCSKYQRVTRNQICTYQPSKDSCQGDSGGSIDFRHSNGLYYAVGIVSYGFGCAQRKHPGVYTKINNYLSWIETTTGETLCRT